VKKVNYNKIICHIQKEDLEVLSTYFFEQQCVGIEIVEKTENRDDHFGEIYTLNNDDYPEEGLLLIGYFENINGFDGHLTHFLKNNQIFLLDAINTSIIEEVDYEKEYQKHYEEIIVNDKISIIPSWFEILDKDKIYVKIEPGLGFGTGSHTSTQLAIDQFLAYYKQDDTLLDFGTGSGILAILAKKCGLKTVYGLEIDPYALKNARMNASLNEVNIEFSESIHNFKYKVSIIIANIVYDILIDNLDLCNNHLEDNGILILSGLLLHQKENMINQLQTHHFQVLDIKSKDNWVSIVARKEV